MVQDDAKKNLLHSPTILVILGVTGDLTARKIIPALFNLYVKEKLPEHFRIVGFARRELSPADFRAYVAEKLKIKVKDPDEAKLRGFLDLFSYARGNFDDGQSYETLKSAVGAIETDWGLCTNKLFYLAVPPEYYQTIFTHLSQSGLTDPCSAEEGYARVLVEKPFGKNWETAAELDQLLAKLFKEVQIYRIDHYLAKEMLQNILNFRFSNNLFEHIWSNQFIESIEIRLWESLGVEDRGAFYDGLGTLRDVGQNHLLQMLALMTMEEPVALSAEAVRPKRAEILKTFPIMTSGEIRSKTFRAQYRGYRQIKGVGPNSDTETFFSLKTELSSPRWERVPVLMESGKRMGAARKEIMVTFKHPTPCLCLGEDHLKNRVLFSLEPQEGITIEFWAKKPGLEYEIEKRTFDFSLRKGGERTQYVEEYEKLLLDAISGDQILFVSSEEVSEMWRFIDPIAEVWGRDGVPLEEYAPDAAEISKRAEEKFFADTSDLKKEIGIIGLGKMGEGLALHLLEQDWRVLGYNRSFAAAERLEKDGLIPRRSIRELVESLPKPRLIWLMVPAGEAVDQVLFGEEGVTKFVEAGDIVIDGGNSFYEDTLARLKKIEPFGIHFLDAGVSGGPRGARRGASLMVGGGEEIFRKLLPLWKALSIPQGFQHVGSTAAGHFVKMVHNGIEYGMMQSLAEGFAVMKAAPFKLNLKNIAEIYNHGSVIESRLVGWLKAAYEKFGEELETVSGSVAHTGEGEWTVNTAEKLGVEAPVIKDAFQFRVDSGKKPSYIGRILSALRNQFGGHSIEGPKS